MELKTRSFIRGMKVGRRHELNTPGQPGNNQSAHTRTGKRYAGKGLENGLEEAQAVANGFEPHDD